MSWWYWRDNSASSANSSRARRQSLVSPCPAPHGAVHLHGRIQFVDQRADARTGCSTSWKYASRCAGASYGAHTFGARASAPVGDDALGFAVMVAL
jgi:hypothetical protein